MFGNLISSAVSLTEDVATIVVAPVQVVLDTTRVVTAPVAAVAAETASVIKSAVDDVADMVRDEKK